MSNPLTVAWSLIARLLDSNGNRNGKLDIGDAPKAIALAREKYQQGVAMVAAGQQLMERGQAAYESVRDLAAGGSVPDYTADDVTAAWTAAKAPWLEAIAEAEASLARRGVTAQAATESTKGGK